MAELSWLSLNAWVMSTLIITEPSFRWRLTFRPILERAQFKSNLHTAFSPLYSFVSDLAPAAAADRQGFVFVKNVKLNVAVFAFAIPRVLTSFSHLLTHQATCVIDSSTLSPLLARNILKQRDCCESKANLAFLFDLSLPPSIVWALTPAIKWTFKRACSALGAAEGTGSSNASSRQN